MITSRSGGFIAPLGLNGLMKASVPPTRDFVSLDRIRATDQTLDYDKVITFGSDGDDLFVCAIRKNGIATIESTGGADSPALNFTIHGELDVVDVCWLAITEAPRAAAALCRDGTLLLFDDILDQGRRLAIQFDEVQGTAYRVLSARGLVIILTSRGLCVLSGLFERVRQGKRAGRPPVSGIIEPIEAIDANLVGERWLLVATQDAVLRYDVNRFAAKPQNEPAPTPQDFNPIAINPAVTRCMGMAELVPAGLG